VPNVASPQIAQSSAQSSIVRVVQQAVSEFEIHFEMHVASPFRPGEGPSAFKVFEWPVNIGRVDPLAVRPQHHAAAKFFTEHFEADHQIRQHFCVIAKVLGGSNPRGRRPGQELWIAGHIGHQIIHLIRRVRQAFGFRMGGHYGAFDGDLPATCRMVSPEIQVFGRPTDHMTQSSVRPAYVIDQMISAKSIAARIEALAAEIAEEYQGTDKLIVVGLLRGSFVFIADLVRELDLPVEVDFLEASSYGDGMESSREVRILKDLRGQIEGRDVLVVEDIVDTGHTLHQVIDMLNTRHPRKLNSIALLDKPSRREVDMKATWTGFEIPDEFVVGYGIDYAQRNRNLPFIGKVRFV